MSLLQGLANLLAPGNPDPSLRLRAISQAFYQLPLRDLGAFYRTAIPYFPGMTADEQAALRQVKSKLLAAKSTNLAQSMGGMMGGDDIGDVPDLVPGESMGGGGGGGMGGLGNMGGLIGGIGTAAGGIMTGIGNLYAAANMPYGNQPYPMPGYQYPQQYPYGTQYPQQYPYGTQYPQQYPYGYTPTTQKSGSGLLWLGLAGLALLAFSDKGKRRGR